MATAIRLGDLGSLETSEREQVLGGIVDAALGRVNGQAAVIKARIMGYESRYELTSSQLLEGLRNNTIRETAEVSEWLFWLRVRHLSGQSNSG